MDFPDDEIPDGDVFAPHHYTYALLISVLATLVVWDDYSYQEPVMVMALLGIGLFAFLFVWTYYPVAGSVFSLLAPCAVIAVVAIEWTIYPMMIRYVVIGGAVLSLDDAVEHAFGVPTPADIIWKKMLLPIMR